MSDREFLGLEQKVIEILELLDSQSCCYIGYSGGMDSTVLLSIFSRFKKEQKVCAVYIDHGLQAEAEQWDAHCFQVAKNLQIDYLGKEINLNVLPGTSVEACAREARYKCFQDLLKSGDILVTAHHQRDQAETLLLQLIRGAGPTGLSSMPQEKILGAGQLIRPFLEIDYSILLKYAQAYKLKWINDPSNLNLKYDRNYIRQKVMPILQKRWPSVNSTLARSALLCAEAVKKQDMQLENFWGKVFVREEKTLCWQELQKHAIETQRLLLRKWFRLITNAYPSAKQLSVLQIMLQAADDKIPCFTFKSWSAYRYRNKLFLIKQESHNYKYQELFFNIPVKLAIDQQVLVNKKPFGELFYKTMLGRGIALKYIQTGECRIGFRQGGERVKPQGRVGSHPLKKLLQEAGIVPWRRYKTSLLFYKDEVIALPNYWVAEKYRATPNEAGILVFSK